MREDAPTVRESESLEAVASRVRENGARRFPVLQDGQLAGIVTVTDLVRAIADGEGAGNTTVDGLAEPEVNTTWAGAPLQVAERELFYSREPYAVVLDDDGEMNGILTEVDVISVATVVEGEEDAGESIAEQDDEWMWEGIKATGNRYLPTRNVGFPDGPVSEYMTDEVVTVTGKRTAQDAAQSMISNDIEQIPLVRAEALAGMVRDVDLLEAL
jgi:IMP dehydrogenase